MMLSIIIIRLMILELCMCAGPPKINVPPRFKDTAVFEKGEEIVIKIPFTGFPKPSVKWMRGDNELKTGDKYKVEVGERHAILTIRNTDRMDDGPYRLELDNDLGTDSAIIKLAVNGTYTSLYPSAEGTYTSPAAEFRAGTRGGFRSVRNVRPNRTATNLRPLILTSIFMVPVSVSVATVEHKASRRRKEVKTRLNILYRTRFSHL